MARKASKDYYLEDLYVSQTVDKSMELSALRDITNGFSIDSEIGKGGYGVVYKGVLRDGRFVAVKKFHSAIENTSFRDEVDCLTRIQHPNIVQYLGFCSGSYNHLGIYENRNVIAECRHQLICFEYLRNGNLGQHIGDKPCQLEWHMCYKIIQGICLGLNYLHENSIIHRDMKPDNILLDDSMASKIADFGISRLLGNGESRIITEKICGTLGYMANECINGGVFTVKSDIYSLGIIISNIVMGCGTISMDETVLEWSRRLNLGASKRHTPLEQVKSCIEISISCRQHEAHNRPVMQDILGRLGIAETSSDRSALGGMNASSMTQPSARASATGPADTNPEMNTRWLERTTARTMSKMLSSRSLNIANNKRWNWRWNSFTDSRFGECAVLISVYDLAVTGEVLPRELSAGKSYTVYLLYKMEAGSTSGLSSVQTSSLRLHGERILATNKVSLDPEARGSASDVTYPDARADGWLELKLAEFTNDDDMLRQRGVLVDLRENDLTIKKSGLIVEGMEFRSN